MEPEGSEAGTTANATGTENQVAESGKLKAVPAAFTGQWAMIEEGGCSKAFEDGKMQVEDRKLTFYNSWTDLSDISELDDGSVAIAGTFTDEGQPSPIKGTLSLSEGGKTMTTRFNDFRKLEWERCDATAVERPAPAPAAKVAEGVATPQSLRGKWVFRDIAACSVEPFNDLIVQERHIVIGGWRGLVNSIEPMGPDNARFKVTYNNGKTDEMSLGLMDGGKRIAFGQKGASGMVFERCPS